MSETNALSFSQTIISFIISILTVGAIIAGVFRWKVSQIVNSQKFKILSKHDIDKLEEAVKRLCDQIQKIDEKVNREITSSKEEHSAMQIQHKEELASMQIQYHELVKELYQLIGEVKGLKDK